MESFCETRTKRVSNEITRAPWALEPAGFLRQRLTFH